jgi:TPR repeat protein
MKQISLKTHLLRLVILVMLATTNVIVYSQNTAHEIYLKGFTYFQNGDLENSIKCWTQAAEQGYDKAQYELGVCYQEGEGVTQNLKEAAKWFRMSANQGNADAQYGLALCYINGTGVKQNYTEAAKWLRKAADQGMAKAQYGLGLCYQEGEGVEENRAEAEKWFRKAAAQGHAKAKSELSSYNNNNVAQNTTKPAPKTTPKADSKPKTDAPKANTPKAETPKSSVQQGDDYFNLGLKYYNEKNLTEAVKYYRKAAELGHSGAQYNL